MVLVSTTGRSKILEGTAFLWLQCGPEIMGIFKHLAWAYFEDQADAWLGRFHIREPATASGTLTLSGDLTLDRTGVKRNIANCGKCVELDIIIFDFSLNMALRTTNKLSPIWCNSASDKSRSKGMSEK